MDRESTVKKVYISPKLKIRPIDLRDVIVTSETGIGDKGQDGGDFGGLIGGKSSAGGTNLYNKPNENF